LVLSVVGVLQFDRWDVAAVFVEAVVVEPVDPFGGGQLEFLDRAPGLAWFDQFGLVQAVDGLGQGIVIGASDGPDGGLDTGFGEAFGEPDRRVLGTPICMVDNIFQVDSSFLLAGPDGLFDRVEHHRGGHRRCDSPAQDPACVGVGDEGYVGESRPRGYVGEVGDPQPVGCWRGEPSLDEISRTDCGGVGDRGAPGLAPDRAGQAEVGHQPLHGATGHVNALAVQREPHFAGTVDAVVRGMDPRDQDLERLVTDLAAAGLAAYMVVVGRWGDRHTELAQLCADRLDTPPQTIRAITVALMIGDEPGD
jgi:hypothetical protein